MLNWLICLKTDLTKKIETKKREHCNPDCKVNLPVKNSPVICLVSNAKELKSKSNLDESENNLHRVQPASAALFELLQ